MTKHPPRRLVLGGIAGLTCAVSVPAEAARLRPPVARTPWGRIQGLHERGVLAFKGVRYGRVGRRFQAPLAPERATGLQVADRYGPRCPQRGAESDMSEDCLVLNIWTPSLEDPRRPVLVYLHGGGYMWGGGDAPETHGAALAARGDCVVVTLNHRLNLFGHLHLEPLFGPDYAGAANAGLLDIIAALRWVRDGISAFGGDASRVTLFGQSGGGAKIATLMAMPQAEGLFHRAWTMSGQQVTAQGPRAALARTHAVLKAIGVEHGDGAGLQAVSTDAVLAALSLPDTSGAGALYCGPVLDGLTLPRHPFWPDAPAQSASVPMVLGNTRQETSILIGGSDPGIWTLTWDTLPARLQTSMVSDLDVREVIRTYRALYPALDPAQVFIAATTAGRSWRGQVIEAEARAAQGSPTWVYQLDWRSPRDGGKWGAFHTLDIPLVFANTAVPESASGDGEEARRVSAQMADALIAFAYTGAPGAGWPRYDLAHRATRIFDVAARIENDPRGAERRLFARVPYIQPGTF